MSKQAGDEKERIPCDVCGVTFKTERYLKVHVKKFHEKGKIAESEKNEKEELVELQSSDSDWDVDPEICLEDDMLDVTSGRDESGNKSESNVICLESSSDNIKCDGNKLKTKSKSIKGILRMQTKPTLFVPKRKCPMMELSKDMFKKQKVLTSQTKAVTSQTKVGTIQKNNVTTEKEENLINIDCELNLETDGRSTHEMTIKSESKKVFQSFETITSGANQREQTISLGDYLPKGMNIKPEDVVIRRIITEGKCVLQMEMMCKKA